MRPTTRIRELHKLVLALVILGLLVTIINIRIAGSMETLRAPAQISTTFAATSPVLNLTFGGHANASMYPYGVGVDADGYIYVADTFNDRVLKYNSTGSLVLKWGDLGNKPGKFKKPHGLVVDTDGYVYVADTGNHRIQKFDSNGTFMLKWGSYGSGHGQFVHNLGIAVSRDLSVGYSGPSYVYVSDRPNHRVQKFCSNGTFVLQWGPSPGPGNLSDPRGIAVDAVGNVYVVDMALMTVKKFDENGTFLGIQWGKSGTNKGQFMKPKSIHVDSDGYVYVADSFNHRIQKFYPNGSFVLKWGNFGFGDGQMFVPRFLDIDLKGDIYVADCWNYRIQKFDSNGTFLMKIQGTPPQDGKFTVPYDAAVGADGSIFVVEAGNHRIQKFDSSGSYILKWGYRSPDFVAKIGACPGTFNYPRYLSIDAIGNLYVSDNFNHRIQKFDSNGSFLLMWGGCGTGDGQLRSPQGIAASNDGYVYVVDSQNNRIQEFDSSGNFILKFGASGSGNGSFKGPKGIVATSDGYVYVADTGNHRIQKFSSNGTFMLQWGGYGNATGKFNQPNDVAVDTTGKVYVVDNSNRRIQVFDNAGTFLYMWGEKGSGPGQFNSPSGITIDLDNAVYVVENVNSRVQKFLISEDTHTRIHPIVWNNVAYYVVTVSNASIAPVPMIFVQSKGMLNFNVTGENGTTGFVNVTIPKALLDAAPSEWSLIIDEQETSPTIVETQTDTTISFLASLSTKGVFIFGTSTIPELMPNALSLSFLLITVTGLATAKAVRQRTKVRAR